MIVVSFCASNFSSNSSSGKVDFNVLVMEELEKLLNELGIGDVKVHVNKMNNANLIGTAIAALS